MQVFTLVSNLFGLIRNTFAVVGIIISIIFIALTYANYLSDKPRSLLSEDAGITGTIMSPDRRFKAVVVNENGGGGISPYCLDAVYVSSASIPDNRLSNDDNGIVFGSCGILIGSPDDSIRWDSANELRIAINPTKGSRGVSRLSLKGYAMSGQIKIVYTSSIR